MNISISTALGFERKDGQTMFENLDERLRLIKNAGFEHVTLWWAEDEFDKQSDQMKLLDKYGIVAENAHLPYKSCNDIWMPKEYNETYSENTIKLIKECAQCGIGTVVFHITTSKIAPMYNEAGLDRIKRIVDQAEKYNVKIAFENLRMPKHLDYVISNIHSDKVGICFDSGHNNYCYPADNILRKYSDKAFAIHLHDNCGTSDEHLIPFDGIAPWDDITQAIADSPLNSISLEIHKYAKYDNMTREEYLQKAYNSALKLRDMVLSKRN